MRLFQRLFYQPKHKEKTTGEQSIYRILAPSVISIFICAVCLCGASWAWFTASTSTGITTIQSSSYKLQYQFDNNSAEELSEEMTLTVSESGSCKITLSAGGTTGATGYCSIKVGEEAYYTGQISAGGSTFTFTVNAAANTKIVLTPKWGTYSGTEVISNGDSIGASSSSLSAQANDLTDNAAAADEAPTVDTPATPDSSPAESETVTPEPAPTDTEPTPAP